jgi:hypothetical protein
MTISQIEVRKNQETVKHDTAQKIRALLDEAKKAYGKTWEDDDAENSILELVTSDEE